MSAVTAAKRRQLARIAAYARDRGRVAYTFGDTVTIWDGPGESGTEHEVTTLDQARRVVGA